MRRFLRGLVWGGFLGAVLALYFAGRSAGVAGGDGGDEVRLRRLRRAALGEAAERSLRQPGASRLRLALDAGRAAVDATLALLGRKA